MKYDTIRYVICFVAFIICFILIKRSEIIKKNRWYVISFVVVSFMSIILYLTPFENLFMSFSSPEKAFNYMNSYEIKHIVSGSETDFVIAGKNGADTYRILPKTEKGWKLSTSSDTDLIFEKTEYKAVIRVYQYKDTNDYYITIYDFDGIYNVSDNRNSDFYSVSFSNDTLDKTTYHYFTCIQNINDSYILSLNETDIMISVDWAQTQGTLLCAEL